MYLTALLYAKADEMVLITYRSESQGREIWACQVCDSAAQFLRDVQEYKDEKYFIVNVLELTDEQAKEFDGALIGM